MPLNGAMTMNNNNTNTRTHTHRQTHPNSRLTNADNFSHLVVQKKKSWRKQVEREKSKKEKKTVLKFNFLQFVEHINRTF